MVGGDLGGEPAGVAGVKFLGGGAIVQGGCVNVGKEGDDPGGGDGVEGEVAGGVKEGGHGWSGGVVGLFWLIGVLGWTVLGGGFEVI